MYRNKGENLQLRASVCMVSIPNSWDILLTGRPDKAYENEPK